MHAETWARAQLVITANIHSWKEAHHIKCALDGSVSDTCVVPAFSVTDKVLAAEATAITSCATLAPITAPTDAPTTAPSNAPTDAPTTAAPTNAPTDAPTTSAPTMSPYWQSAGGLSVCASGYTTIKDSSDCTAALEHISGSSLVPRTGSHQHHPIGCFVATDGNTQDLFLNDPGAGTQETFTYEDSSILCKFAAAAMSILPQLPVAAAAASSDSAAVSSNSAATQQQSAAVISDPARAVISDPKAVISDPPWQPFL